ncbi:serine protease [Streptomyces sp. NPDC051636]|uniref:serine protease n=1 Tax=Streptomyces sp. NPDC051636 TaxID=3365663 RepID=UPI003787EF56
MACTGERAVESDLRTPRWIARIHDAEGRIVGAGVLLSPDRVLTCAHVVEPDRPYVVHFVGAAAGAVPTVAATVREREWIPEESDDFGDRAGDLALLRLAEARPAEDTTRLFRLATSRQGVRMYGFPVGDDGGRWHGGQVVGGRGRDGQVQLRPERPEELAGPGFSGGGVLDLATGRLIGIVLSVDEGHPSLFTYMSPAETVLRHLPQVAAWTAGRSAVDPKLRPRQTTGELDVEFATELAGWFRGEGWPVLVTVVPVRGRRAWTLGRAVTLADRELRTRHNTSRFSDDPPDTVPPAGGHDLALVVKGLTVTQVTELIAERLGVPIDPLGGLPEQFAQLRTPLAAVLVGVDEAAEPGRLLGLLDRLAQQGARLLLVFRGAGGLAEHAEQTLVRQPLQARWTRLRSQLDRIVDRLGPALHERLGRVRPDPATRELIGRADDGYRRTVVLREQVAARPVPAPRRADDLFVYEAAAERRRRRLEQATDALDVRIRRRDELQGRVAGVWSLWRQRSGPPDIARDLEAYRLYETASRLLRRRPCDIEEAQTAVERFVAFGSGRPGGGVPVDGPDAGGGGAGGGAGGAAGSGRSGDGGSGGSGGCGRGGGGSDGFRGSGRGGAGGSGGSGDLAGLGGAGCSCGPGGLVGLGGAGGSRGVGDSPGSGGSRGAGDSAAVGGAGGSRGPGDPAGPGGAGGSGGADAPRDPGDPGGAGGEARGAGAPPGAPGPRRLGGLRGAGRARGPGGSRGKGAS